MGLLTRFKFLCLKGPTKTCKTSRAASLFPREQTLVIDCQGSKEPNLKDVTNQKCLVFDEGTVEMVINNKAIFQAGIEGCQVQESPTQQYTQFRWLYGVAMIVCTNEWLTDEHPKAWHDWINENCIYVEVTEPMYEPRP